jgi:hypothetical protein
MMFDFDQKWGPVKPCGSYGGPPENRGEPRLPSPWLWLARRILAPDLEAMQICVLGARSPLSAEIVSPFNADDLVASASSNASGLFVARQVCFLRDGAP